MLSSHGRSRWFEPNIPHHAAINCGIFFESVLYENCFAFFAQVKYCGARRGTITMWQVGGGGAKVKVYYTKAVEAAEYIGSRIAGGIKTAVILGSGLGHVVDRIKDAVVIDYRDIPHFPAVTVKGHEGMLVCGMIGGRGIIALKGRFHYYEGYDMADVVFPVRALGLLGVENLIVTNAAGAINKDYRPGDLMIIKDHISLFLPSPLRGGNCEKLGVRFPDMSEAYSKQLILLAIRAANELNIQLKEGVYAYTQGPMYETPAEVKALAALGADAAGMSTVPEVIAARHMGVKVLGISCITNMTAGIANRPLNHEEVMNTAKAAEEKFSGLVSRIVGKLDA